MGYGKLRILNLVLQPYVLEVLRELKNNPKRFKELQKFVKNERTLSLKLAKLQDYKLVEMTHLKTDGKYVNFYMITNLGKEVLTAIEDIKLSKS
ncbi:MAG: winged helix-turn-helix transcriptional regulator [Candidatus Micrarchaeota archaeon]|nr:winged helix-turn-helix transcriptional regulator [Candidatus Micrarchaeota archaeon]MDE1848282.1 winged helix-turn-helix transcriptional regulator [Candidatus Micrarchaeota archaeon]MDE1864315.1 winged helix-turn-helix transcriptional regulator [Candidatus Micrarchaeota archaeon]